MIQPIVEGQGEVGAVPELLRRFIQESGEYGLVIGNPIRRKKSELIREEPLRRAVRLALLNRNCKAILILFDSDDSCPKELAPEVEKWAKAEAGRVPCAVVMANREYEAWFLAAMTSLRGKRGIREDAVYDQDPESRRGAKEAVEACMQHGRTYSETADQTPLTATFNMSAAYAKSRSFRKMVKAFGELSTGMGINLSHWPPAAWIKGSE